MKKIYLINSKDKRFPPLLRGLDGVPESLYMSGGEKVDWQSLWRKTVAVVGARRVSAQGRSLALKMGGFLAKMGVTVVSGFMWGVDALAHEACLDQGGQTVAVLGSGMGKLYPSFQMNLKSKFLKGRGVFFSEFGTKVGPAPQNFLQRNRLVAGMSDCVLVIEAARRSGTLNTARWAGEYGRDVWAVPGSLGADWLIQEGARTIKGEKDLLRILI